MLDGLRALRGGADSALAFRYSCINANACKECMMRIDDKVDYACAVSFKEGMNSLAPFPKKMIVHDLVTERTPPDERLHPKP